MAPTARPTPEVPTDELRERIGTPYYRYGIHTSHSVFVQPAALIRGLANTLPANVTVQENTPVLNISKGPTHQIKTPMRTFRAEQVVPTNNGFARHLGFLKSRLITIYTYAGITLELSPHDQQLHGSYDEWGVIPANRLGTTLRKIRGGRSGHRTVCSWKHRNAGRTHSSGCTSRAESVRSHAPITRANTTATE